MSFEHDTRTETTAATAAHHVPTTDMRYNFLGKAVCGLTGR